MRILLTTPYDLAVPGGVNRHTLDLLDQLTRAGVSAKLVGPASRPVFVDDPRIELIGSVWVGALNGAHSRVTLDLDLGPQVRRLLQRFNPTVVHLQEPFLPTLNSYFLQEACRVRRVGTFHTYSETSKGYLFTWPGCQFVLSQLDARIAVSEPAREFATRYHRTAMQVIPHGVVLPDLNDVREAKPVAQPLRVFFLGRMDEPRKGFGVLCAALRVIEAQAPSVVRLTAVGAGQEAWQETTRGLPIEFLGELSDKALGKAWAHADVCCVPSLGGESFGLVALEALAHGVPVVASRIRGYAEWLSDAGVGELVEPNDPVALAASLLSLANDASRFSQWQQAARPFAETYSWETVLPRWLELYRD